MMTVTDHGRANANPPLTTQPQIDYAKCQRMLFALYYLMSSQHFSAGPLAPISPRAAAVPPSIPPPPLSQQQQQQKQQEEDDDDEGGISMSSDGAEAGGDDDDDEEEEQAAGAAVAAAAAAAAAVPVGVLPCAGDADQAVWKFVLNLTQNDTLNLGVARCVHYFWAVFFVCAVFFLCCAGSFGFQSVFSLFFPPPSLVVW